MTEKKEKILLTALALFSEQGFHATSTAKVAKAAGVSEGLIFRHFTNKDGLLQAILDLGKSRTEALLQPIQAIEDPKVRLKAVLLIPSEIAESEHPFWRLIFALKWQTEYYDPSLSEQMLQLIESCFKALAYKDPALEAQIVMLFIDGLAGAILLKHIERLEETKELILKKYQLNKINH